MANESKKKNKDKVKENENENAARGDERKRDRNGWPERPIQYSTGSKLNYDYNTLNQLKCKHFS